jgi:hypothetical protein
MRERTETKKWTEKMDEFSVNIIISLLLLPLMAVAQTPSPGHRCIPPRPVPIDRWRGEYFNNRNLSGPPVMIRDEGLQNIDFDWGLGSPLQDCHVNVDQFSVRWTRTVAFAGGAYRFNITSDDGVRLFIDGQEKFSAWQERPLTTNTIEVAITPGNHKIVLEYFENFGSAVAELSWQSHPCVSTVAADHWRGEYFNRDNPGGQPVMVRDDGEGSIEFDWSRNSPAEACGVKPDFFSVRWSRRAAFAAGIYRFNIRSDAGARIYVNGQLRFDQWGSQTHVSGFFDLKLDAGNHQLIFEYRSAGGRSYAGFNWKPVPCHETVDPAHWRGEYFKDNSLNGPPVMVRDDGDNYNALDFNWSNDSPSPGCNVPVDGFSVRWTGSPLFDKGVHRFSLTGYGGVRLSIDGQMKIDQWISKAQRYTFDVELSAGSHQIVLEYTDFGGRASIKLTRQPPPCAETVPAGYWKGEYFDNKNLSGRPSIVRDEGGGMIDSDWGLDAPNRDCLKRVDGFSARWSRIANFAPGTYRFTVTADDGVRLFVDGKKLIDEWRDQNSQTYSVDLELKGGPHQVRLEYFENFGSASIKLSWATTRCTAVVLAERWKGEYYNNLDLSGKPVLVRDDGEERLNFDWNLQGPDGSCGVNIDNFSARWTRKVTFGAGIFRFNVSADDGVRVYIDRQLKFERWVDQMTTHTFDLQLAAGNHEITVEYYERWGSAVLKFSWEQHPCYPAVPPDHWRGEYFDNANLGGQPVMVRNHGDNFLSFNQRANHLSAGCHLSADNFSVRWTRKVILSGGLYRFTLAGDEGMRFFVNGKKLIDQWGNQQSNIYTADIYLPPGNHRFILEYCHQTGEAVAKLDWRLSRQ